MNKKAMIVLSGGQDSATCAFFARELGYELHAVTIDYGQRHQRELLAAELIGKLVGAKTHEYIYTGLGILTSTSPLVDSTQALEQYEDHASLPGGIEKTFVPLRNQMFLTMAANRAVARGCSVIITGVCQEDFGGYPDCRRTFISALEKATNLSLEGAIPEPLEFLTPLMYLTKAKAVELAMGLPGCYAALAWTHTAYDGVYPPAGKDHASLLRAKGFEEAGVPDPLVLRAVLEGHMDAPKASNYSEASIEQVLPLLKHDPAFRLLTKE